MKIKLWVGFLVFISLIFILKVSANAESIISSSTSPVNLLNGSYEGSIYLSKDNTATSGSKLTFGYPNYLSFSYNKSMSASTVISSGNLSSNSPISRSDYGANVIWYDGGYGLQNPTTNTMFQKSTELTNNIGVTSLRYPGGIPSDTFHWYNAIGKQGNRQPNVVYQGGNTFFPSTFGPDEFGSFLESTKNPGDITVNFGTGTAQEAANWVQYMTSTDKNNPLVSIRTKNGHPGVYQIPYWEVGNETESRTGENYWRSGSLVSLNTANGKCPSEDINLCEYVFGGTTQFKKQKTIALNNTTSSNGTPSQSFFVEYPPLIDNSQTIFVGDTLWRKVSNLGSYSAYDSVYQIDNTTGQILFGNGVHGRIPPAGAIVTASYQSGVHDGFLQYYNLMKAANSSIRVCSSYDSPTFIELMGNSYAYDCIVSHLYSGSIPSGDTSISHFHNLLVEQSFGFQEELTDEQALINKYAGGNAHKVQIALTEYGINALTLPSGFPDYHKSLDAAITLANTLRIIIQAHIPIAEKHYLISYVNSQAPDPQVYINSNKFANNSLISGPASNATIQPSAYVIQAFSKLLFSNLITSGVSNNPTVSFGGGNYPSLETLATTNGKGDEAILVLNLSQSNSIKTEIKPSVSSFKNVSTNTLGSNNSMAFNTTGDSSVVGFVNQTAKLKNGKILVSFPPDSLSVIRFSK